MNVQRELVRLGIKPKVSLDQFFLTDEKIAEKLVEVAKVTKNDRVLEVGPGLGVITRRLAFKAREVVAIEIDRRFKPVLNRLPRNVKVVYGDAYRLLNDKGFQNKIKPISKTVSNIPYSQAQNMLHNYTNSDWYQGDLVWLAPASMAKKINKEPILGAFFKAKVVELVPKSAFFPQPKTTSAIIIFQRVADPVESNNFEIYFRRWLYNHEHWKIKNALREGIINAAWDLMGKKVTKNQARNLMSKLGLANEELEKLTNNIQPKYYFEIPQKIKKIMRI